MNYKATKAWQLSMAASIDLCRLAEDLPQQEDQALAPMLRAAAIDLTSFVATDLINGVPARMDALVRLETILAVINTVYPAIETAGSEQTLEQLRAQLHIYTFSEVVKDNDEAETDPAEEE